MTSTDPALGAKIAVLLFPGVTQLDYVGPVEVLGRCPGATIRLVAETPEIATDLGAVVRRDAALSEVRSADVLLVPGGPGATDAMLEPAVIAFVRALSRSAGWTASVCTGAFILGAAGVLTGRRATTHWASRPLLDAFGCTTVDDRVVIDGHIATAAGVSAGIDLGLRLAGEIFDSARGALVEASLEYAPEPPYGTGTLEDIPPRWLETGRESMRSQRGAAVDEAARRLMSG